MTFAPEFFAIHYFEWPKLHVEWHQKTIKSNEDLLDKARETEEMQTSSEGGFPMLN